MKKKNNDNKKRRNSNWGKVDKDNLVMANKDEDVIFLRNNKK